MEEGARTGGKESARMKEAWSRRRVVAAIEGGSVGSVEKAMAASVDVNAACPLHAATSSGSVEMVKAVLGANRDIVEACRGWSRGLTPLRLAYLNGFVDDRELERLTVDVDRISPPNYPLYGASALCLAVEKQDLATAKVLINSGADCVQKKLEAARKKAGLGACSPLATAIAKNDADMVEVLLSTPLIDLDGLSVPLTTQMDPKILQLVLKAGYRASVDVLSSAFSDLGLLATLIDLGADPMATGPNGTALHRACAQNHADASKFLLFRTADRLLEALDARSRTPLSTAAANGAIDCLRVLIDHCPPERRLEIVSLQDANGWNALDAAAHFGHPDCLRALCEFAPFLANRLHSNSLDSPLVLAVRAARPSSSSHLDCVRLLIDLAHVDVNLPLSSNGEYTALDFANCPRVAHILRQAGATSGLAHLDVA